MRYVYRIRLSTIEFVPGLFYSPLFLWCAYLFQASRNFSCDLLSYGWNKGNDDLISELYLAYSKASDDQSSVIRTIVYYVGLFLLVEVASVVLPPVINRVLNELCIWMIFTRSFCSRTLFLLNISIK